MKRIFIVVLAAMVVSFGFLFFNQTISDNLPPASARDQSKSAQDDFNISTDRKSTYPEREQNKPLPEISWLAESQAKIRSSEYQITWQEKTYLDGSPSAYHAVNRAHDIRSYFMSDGIYILNRSNSQGSWEFGICLSVEKTKAVPVARGNLIEYQYDGILEQYINDENGLKQRLIISENLSSIINNHELRVIQSFTGLSLALDEKKMQVYLSDNDREVLQYGGVAARDSSGRLLPIIMVLQGNSLILTTSTPVFNYPVTIEATIEGVVPDYSWRVTSDQAGANLGTSVANAGDVNNDGFADVIVGAPNYDNGQADEGKVFVYYGSASGLPTDASWTTESNQPEAQMGISVSTAGNVNGDAYDDVIIGANWYDTDQEEDAGRAYVFHGSSSGLNTTAAWIVDGDSSDALFGETVSTAGDVNNDGFDDVIIGAPGWSLKGKVYVFHGSGSGLSTTANSTFFDSTLQNLGISVDTAGDVNGDSFDDVILGAQFSSQYLGGLASVYYGSGAGLSTIPNWTIGITQMFAGYGSAVSTAGDVNYDGYDDIIVGAPDFDTDVISDTGKVFVYYGSSAGPSTSEDWSFEGDVEFSAFGSAVDTAGDVNGDNFSDVIIGAYAYENIGRAYIFQGSTTGLNTSAEWVEDGEQSFTGFGASVSTAGDINGDGSDDVLVGASEFFQGDLTYGAAYAYFGIPDLLATNDSPTILGDLTSFTATLTISGNYTFTWDFGDDSPTKTGQYIGHTYPSIGLFTATVTATGGEVDLFDTTQVMIEEAITGLSATNDGPTILGNLTTLSASITAGSNVTYTWDFGDGSPTTTGQVVTHTYPTAGIYIATVTATNSVSSQSTTTQVTVDQVITGLSATNDGPTALGSLTTLSASITAGSNVTYTWDFGDGSPTAPGQVVTHTYPAVSSYTATVTASNSVSSQSTTTQVTVDQTITGLSASNDGPTALGNLTTLSASITAGSNVTYTWDFGDGSPTAPGQFVTHTYLAAGVYTATVTATNSVSSQSTTTQVTVDQTITGLSASNDGPTTLGSMTTLSASITAGSNITYTWDFGDGSPTAPGQVVTHTYAAVGVYTATVTATNSVSSQSTTTQVTIDQAITGLNAINDSPMPLGETTTLTASITAGSNVTYMWDFGDGSPNQAGKVVTHVYPADGNYTATVTATNSVSSSNDTTVVTIGDAIAGLTAENDGPTILGEITTLTATITSGSSVTYEWDFGDGSPVQYGESVTHQYAAVGIYTATVTATNTLGQSTAATSVYVDVPITGLNAVNDGPTTIGEITTLTAWVVGGTNVTYYWFPGDGSPSQNGQVITHIYPSVQSFVATVYATNSVSQVSKTTLVIIDPVKLFLPVIVYE